METIKITYKVNDVDGVDFKDTIRRQAKDGLSTEDVCEAFIDFIRLTGFSEDQVYDYFRE